MLSDSHRLIRLVGGLASLAMLLAACGGASAAPAEPSGMSLEADTEAAGDAPEFYTEDWDQSNANWSWFLERGEESEFDLSVADGHLNWTLSATYVWLYLTYDAHAYEDVALEAHVRNLGTNNNNVSLLCRHNDRGWYEFNVANSGLYWIYRYEASTDEFVQLYNGGSENIKVGVGENTYRAVCDGNELSLYINGEHVRTVSDLYHQDGRVGVGVSSFDITPVEILMDYVAISEP